MYRLIRRMHRLIFVVLGFFFLLLGALGAVLPVLPTTPFLIAASYCFARGSKRFRRWFHSTRLYHNYLQGFIKSNAMTLLAKAIILGLVTVFLAIAIYFVGNLYLRLALAGILLCKYYYFIFRIKTISQRPVKD